MKLAASQIAWVPEMEASALATLHIHGFAGVEIAPTLVAGDTPYAEPLKAAAFAERVKESYALSVCSLQSIWYGQSGSMFGPERTFLLEYTKGAILFAQAAGAHNLVFGCPKNRVLPEGETDESAIEFFHELGEYAAAHDCVLALEANPPVYGTNFMNTTLSAFEMVQRVDSPGCLVNLDFGTMLTNGEDVEILRGRVHKINHVHISEPELCMIQRREEHARLATLLKAEEYGGYVSIEMRRQPLEDFELAVAYVEEVFA